MNRKEAYFYKIRKDGKALCQLCPQACVLEENEMSPCGTRMLIDSKFRALSWGHVIAGNIDPVEKKPLYHFMPGSEVYSIGTAGCNMHCKNCQNSDISQASNPVNPSRIITPEQIVDNVASRGLQSIAYTYTEPTIFYEMMYKIAELAHKKTIKNIMVSNGLINPEPLHQLLPVIDAVNIDMKGFNEKVHKEITGGPLKPILKSIETIHKSKAHLEITILLIPGISDKDEELDAFFYWMTERNMHEVPLHISRFYPTYKLRNVPPTPENRIFEVRKKAMNAGLLYVYPGNIMAGEAENTYCPDCGTLAISRQGFSAVNHLKDGKYCRKCNSKIIEVS
ncbi:MAG: AmmeMemoRadiSam system radical SAM enzyme [Candidatus Delongbacteria bacterium]|jgi:pyruvate formate lyase activating enzyme|nr:AmmeMemoRadiSam system radical SAM enzyme [Candidatus Delongbacteria bacterium]